MQGEEIRIVIISPTPERDHEEAHPPDEKFQSSVDDPSFLKKQKKRLTESQVLYKIQNAKKESPNKLSLIRRIFITFATSTCFTFLMTMLMFIPLSKIIIGIIFFHDCPAEPLISLYLVVGGSVACVRDLINMCMRAILTDQAYFDYDVPITLVAFIYTMSEFAWFVYGSIYVYALFGKFQWRDKSAGDYCSSMLYMYAFVLTTMSYFLLFMTCVISGATICIANCLEDVLPKEPPPTTIVIIHPNDPKHQQEQHQQQHQQLQQQHYQQQQHHQQQQQFGSNMPIPPENKQP